jgi:hypothetical protein
MMRRAIAISALGQDSFVNETTPPELRKNGRNAELKIAAVNWGSVKINRTSLGEEITYCCGTREHGDDSNYHCLVSAILPPQQ